MTLQLRLPVTSKAVAGRPEACDRHGDKAWLLAAGAGGGGWGGGGGGVHSICVFRLGG